MVRSSYHCTSPPPFPIVPSSGMSHGVSGTYEDFSYITVCSHRDKALHTPWLPNWICWTSATTKMTSSSSVLQGVLHYPGLPHFIPHPTRSALVPTSAISWTRWTWRSLPSSPAPPSYRRAWRNFVVATPYDPDWNHRVQSISIDYREISRVQHIISDHRRQCLRVGTLGGKRFRKKKIVWEWPSNFCMS